MTADELAGWRDDGRKKGRVTRPGRETTVSPVEQMSRTDDVFSSFVRSFVGKTKGYSPSPSPSCNLLDYVRVRVRLCFRQGLRDRRDRPTWLAPFRSVPLKEILLAAPSRSLSLSLSLSLSIGCLPDHSSIISPLTISDGCTRAGTGTPAHLLSLSPLPHPPFHRKRPIKRHSIDEKRQASDSSEVKVEFESRPGKH